TKDARPARVARRVAGALAHEYQVLAGAYRFGQLDPVGVRVVLETQPRADDPDRPPAARAALQHDRYGAVRPHEGDERLVVRRVVEVDELKARGLCTLREILVPLVVVVDGLDAGPQEEAAEDFAPHPDLFILERGEHLVRRHKGLARRAYRGL